MNETVDERDYKCMPRYLIYNIDTQEIKQTVKLIYAFRIAFSIVLVMYLIYSAVNIVMKYMEKQKIDRLTMYS